MDLGLWLLIQLILLDPFNFFYYNFRLSLLVLSNILCKWREYFHFRIKFSDLVERKRYDLLVVEFIFEANCRDCGGGLAGMGWSHSIMFGPE